MAVDSEVLLQFISACRESLHSCHAVASV